MGSEITSFLLQTEFGESSVAASRTLVRTQQQLEQLAMQCPTTLTKVRVRACRPRSGLPAVYVVTLPPRYRGVRLPALPDWKTGEGVSLTDWKRGISLPVWKRGSLYLTRRETPSETFRDRDLSTSLEERSLST